jgi:hypothetical protein
MFVSSPAIPTLHAPCGVVFVFNGLAAYFAAVQFGFPDAVDEALAHEIVPAMGDDEGAAVEARRKRLKIVSRHWAFIRFDPAHPAAPVAALANSPIDLVAPRRRSGGGLAEGSALAAFTA